MTHLTSPRRSSRYSWPEQKPNCCGGCSPKQLPRGISSRPSPISLSRQCASPMPLWRLSLYLDLQPLSNRTSRRPNRWVWDHKSLHLRLRSPKLLSRWMRPVHAVRRMPSTLQIRWPRLWNPLPRKPSRRRNRPIRSNRPVKWWIKYRNGQPKQLKMPKDWSPKSKKMWANRRKCWKKPRNPLVKCETISLNGRPEPLKRSKIWPRTAKLNPLLRNLTSMSPNWKIFWPKSPAKSRAK